MSCVQQANVWVTPVNVLGDAETLAVHPELLDREGTTSQPAPNAQLRQVMVSSLWQGVGGRSEFGAASQGVGDSPDM